MGDNVPAGWRRLRISEVADVVGGTTPSSEVKEYWGGDVPFVTPTDLTALRGRYLSHTERTITEQGRRAAGLEMLPPNSILLATRASVGLTAVAEIPVTTNQGFQNLVPLLDTDPLWLYYAIGAQRTQLVRLSAGTTFLELSRHSLRAVELLVPPPWEQRAIAAVLDGIDGAIEQTEAVIDATEMLRGALLQDLLTRGVPGWHKEWKHVQGVGTIPTDWDVMNLGDTGRWYSGGTPSKGVADYWQGSIPWVSPKDMKVREIWDAIDHVSHEAARSGSTLVPAGTILLVVRGMILAHSFPVAITRIESAFNQDMKALICRATIVPDYLLVVLEALKPKLLQLPTPSTHGTMRVVTEELFDLEVPIPPEREQQVIASSIAAIDADIDALRTTLSQLLRTKSATSDALLSGRIRVPAMEPAT